MSKNRFCPVHGNQMGIVGIQVCLETTGFELPESLKSRANRKYCMACWIDLMDRELEPLSDSDLDRSIDDLKRALR